MLTRNEMLTRYGDAYFGNWSMEIKCSHNIASYHTISKPVVAEEIVAINEPLEVEQDLAEIIVDIHPESVYTDIRYTINHEMSVLSVENII